MQAVRHTQRLHVTLLSQLQVPFTMVTTTRDHGWCSDAPSEEKVHEPTPNVSKLR
jgi:hypothetical protein